jgi:hypothetical protein
MSGASDQVSDGEVSIPCLQLHVPSPHAAAASPADSDDEVPVPHFTLHPALAILMMGLLSHAQAFLIFTPSLTYVRLQPAL